MGTQNFQRLDKNLNDEFISMYGKIITTMTSSRSIENKQLLLHVKPLSSVRKIELTKQKTVFIFLDVDPIKKTGERESVVLNPAPPSPVLPYSINNYLIILYILPVVSFLLFVVRNIASLCVLLFVFPAIQVIFIFRPGAMRGH
jgi:hypothetical protein